RLRLQPGRHNRAQSALTKVAHGIRTRRRTFGEGGAPSARSTLSSVMVLNCARPVAFLAGEELVAGAGVRPTRRYHDAQQRPRPSLSARPIAKAQLDVGLAL